MKRSFLIALFALILTACSRSSDDLNPRVDVDPSKIEFKLDGSLKTYFQVNAGVVRTQSTGMYTFVGTKATTGDNIFTLAIQCDSLRAGTYNVSTVTFREGSVVATNVNTSISVTITSNVNGLINGTFHGSLYNHSTSTNSTVLSGEIDNIQLRY